MEEIVEYVRNYI